ncbi:MAG TPA: ABC transporter permease [Candidatus Polarisedimenticolia bacterium]|jgi:ABC-2 type transport system permease protein|nr:ABC transporter permease [Candidatus Polarisedimenticolia bacterium]
MLGVYTLWWREQVRFFRQGSRVFGAFAQPLIFWVLFGAGLQASFRPSTGGRDLSYLEYFFPGTIILILLFTAIFSTISVIEDRREGFLQGVLVAPVSRSAIVLGKVLGGTTLALVQGTVLLALSPWAGIHLTIRMFLAAVAVQFAVAFALTALSFCIAWRMDSTQGFHAIMTVFLMPLWLLSGAFFPAHGAPAWLAWVMRINPLTYGTAALRRILYGADGELPVDLPSLRASLPAIAAFGLATFLLATLLARRRTGGATG